MPKSLRKASSICSHLRPLSLLLLALGLVFIACSSPPPASTPTPPPSPTPIVALPPAPALISLPEDDAAHTDFITEWWYYSGHLQSADGRRYAFHYAVFQLSALGQILANVGHVSVTDPQEGTYATDQRASLAALLPAKDSRGFSFDIDGWEMSGYDGRDHLTASAASYAFELNLEGEKPPVLHDRTGLVDFREAGKSFYYSRTRMAVTGSLMVRGRAVLVNGSAWFDHQWGNFTALSIGWDWFALQLSDGSDVMLSLVRDAEGQALHHYGTWVAPV